MDAIGQLLGSLPWYVILIAAILTIWIVKRTVIKIIWIVFGLLSLLKLIHWVLVLYNTHQ